MSEYEIVGYELAEEEDEIKITIEGYAKGQKRTFYTYINSFSLFSEFQDGVWELKALGKLYNPDRKAP